MIADLGNLLHGRLRIGDADGKRRDRRERRIQPEQRVERFPEILADPVVQREVETAASGGRYSVVKQRFQAIGIVRCKRMRGEILDDGFVRFVVALDRSGLAQPLVVAGVQAHERRAREGFFTSCDLERMEER